MSITAVLLSAGYATRLYPLTADRPKALLPLGEHTILDEILVSLATVRGITKRLLVTNHRFAEPFHAWQRTRRVDVEVLDDETNSPETRLGAIRDLELARSRAAASDDLLVVGTDNLFRWPLAEFVHSAQRYSPQPTIALWEAPTTEAATQFGVVTRDHTSRVTAFVEKSSQPPSREVALCVYYFPAPMCSSIRRFLDDGGNADAPGYFIEWLVGRGPVYGVMMKGAWYDIGTIEAYQTAVEEWQNIQVKGDR